MTVPERLSALGSVTDVEDQSEFERLYRLYARRIGGLISRRVSDRALAEDLVQETFMRAQRAWATLDPRRPVWPWLSTIAQNLCIDAWRTQGPPRAPLDEYYETFACAGSHGDPEEAFATCLKRQAINEALASLNPRQRRLLLLKDFEGWRYDDIAELEATTARALRSTLWRARQIFRRTYAAAAEQRGLGVVFLPGLVRRLRALMRRMGLRAGGLSARWETGSASAIDRATFLRASVGAAGIALAVAVSMHSLDGRTGSATPYQHSALVAPPAPHAAWHEPMEDTRGRSLVAEAIAPVRTSSGRDAGGGSPSPVGDDRADAGSVGPTAEVGQTGDGRTAEVGQTGDGSSSLPKTNQPVAAPPDVPDVDAQPPNPDAGPPDPSVDPPHAGGEQPAIPCTQGSSTCPDPGSQVPDPGAGPGNDPSGSIPPAPDAPVVNASPPRPAIRGV